MCGCLSNKEIYSIATLLLIDKLNSNRDVNDPLYSHVAFPASTLNVRVSFKLKSWSLPFLAILLLILMDERTRNDVFYKDLVKKIAETLGITEDTHPLQAIRIITKNRDVINKLITEHIKR